MLLSESCCLVLVLDCSWACWLLPAAVLCSGLLSWSHSSHLCCGCFAQKADGVADCAFSCWTEWKVLLNALEQLVDSLLLSNEEQVVDIAYMRLLVVLRRRWARWQVLVVQVVASPLPGGFAMLLGCYVSHRCLCWVSKRSVRRGCSTLLMDT